MTHLVSPETIHLRPHADVAERVLLPGDPGRALRLAQQLVDGTPKMLNHNRGLWGYSGIAHDGEPLTVQATGMGGPSAAIVVEELVQLGARRFVRVGTCGALSRRARARRAAGRRGGAAGGRREPRARRHRAAARRPRPATRLAGARRARRLLRPLLRPGPGPRGALACGRSARDRDGGGDAVRGRRAPRPAGRVPARRLRHRRHARADRRRGAARGRAGAGPRALAAFA